METKETYKETKLMKLKDFVPHTFIHERWYVSFSDNELKYEFGKLKELCPDDSSFKRIMDSDICYVTSRMDENLRPYLLVKLTVDFPYVMFGKH